MMKPLPRRILQALRKPDVQLIRSAVTLATHCSIDRWPRVRQQLSLWQTDDQPNPASVAVFVPTIEGDDQAHDRQVEHLMQLVNEYVVHQNPSHLSISAVFGSHEGQLYPINALRNQAIAAAPSSLVCSTDGDNLPSSGLARMASHLAEERILPAAHDTNTPPARVLLVVPVFEVGTQEVPDTDSAHVPRTQEQLAAAVGVRPFHCNRYPPAQQSIDYQHWFQARVPFDAPYHEYWEPIGVAHRDVLPPWDERFEGYGLNKVQHALAMAHQGFKFTVMPREFFATVPHKRSSAFTHTFGTAADPIHRQRVEKLYASFKQELSAESGSG